MNDNSLPKISTKALNLSFGEKQVLKNISTGFSAKKITALIGPSGCGKSTLLRCFNRMHDLLSDAHITGEVFLDNTNIYDDHLSVTQIRKKIGMVFQKQTLCQKLFTKILRTVYALTILRNQKLRLLLSRP